MTADPLQLLRQLEPAVRPPYTQAPAAAPGQAFEHQPFEELLAKARAGRVESGRPVTAAFGAEAGEPLTADQLTRLSAAADVAEASGARTALLFIDGRGLVLDVASRTITGELAADSSSRLFNLDAALYVPGDDDAAAPPVGPPGGVAPAAVGRQLDAAFSGEKVESRE